MEELWAAIPRLGIRKWKDDDVIMMFKIAYWLCLRSDEYIGILAENFDLERRQLFLGKTKTEDAGFAVIPEVFLPELALYLIDKHGPLFPGVNYAIVYNWLKRLGKMLDIPALTTPRSITKEETITHIFRKSIGKDMLYGLRGNKAPVNFISKAMRHKGNRAMESTFQYLKISDEELKEWWKENNKDQVI